MKAVPLTAYPRTVTRRQAVKKLRRHDKAPRIPAVIYGGKIQPLNLEVDEKAMKDLIHHAASENVLVDLTVEKDAKPKRLAMVQEVQHHSLSGKMLHIDFHEISADEKVTIMVPVEAVGEATGVKNGGGVLEHVLFKVKVRALPKDLPEQLNVDVSHLEIGQAVHIGDIKPPAGVEVLGDKHISVLSVAAPITEAQEAEAAAAASTAPGEVEMIKEKKEDGEGAPAEKEKAPAAADKAAPKAEEKKPAEKKK